MTYRGTVSGNVILLPPGVSLPDGLEVTIQPIPAPVPTVPTEPAAVTWRNGVPVFPAHSSGSPAPDLELVNALRDETL